MIGHSTELSQFLGWSLLVGGIPYLIVCTGLLMLSARTTTGKFFFWWAYSPFLLAALFGLFLAGVTAYSGGGDGAIKGFFLSWLVTSLYSLLVGYIYIGIAAAIYLVLKKLGFIHQEQSDLRALLS